MLCIRLYYSTFSIVAWFFILNVFYFELSRAAIGIEMGYKFSLTWHHSPTFDLR